jgi:hypothetical protein
MDTGSTSSLANSSGSWTRSASIARCSLGQKTFVEDMRAGRYFETDITHAALLFVAEDLDLERIRQFSEDQQRELRPLAEAVVKARRSQIESYQRNGPHVRVVLMPKTSHYPFVDRTREVATHMLPFLRGQ